MSDGPDYELLKFAYQVLGGIPENRFAPRLGYWCSDPRPGAHGCNTLACGGGWLAMHPEFNARGLTLKKIMEEDAIHELADVFRITYDNAYNLFRTMWSHEDGTGTPKQVILRRIKQYLSDRGQL